MCTYIEIEKIIHCANPKGHAQQQKMRWVDESRLMCSKGISRPILRTERSMQVKIARKLHAKRSEKEIQNHIQSFGTR